MFRKRFRNTCCNFPRIAVIKASFMQVGYDFDVEGPELVLQQRKRFGDGFVKLISLNSVALGAREISRFFTISDAGKSGA